MARREHRGRFIIGAAFGALAGLLLAPKSGEKTRRDLKQKSAALKDQAVEQADQLSQEVKKQTAQLSGQAADLASQAAKRVQKSAKPAKRRSRTTGTKRTKPPVRRRRSK